MTTYKTKKLIMPIILCVLFCVLFMFAAVPGQFVRADEAVSPEFEYTNVLTDLTKDPDFDKSEYPEDFHDSSIRLIQIAESVGGELFVYVYRPNLETSKLLATCISMSVSNSNYSFALYKLRFLNSYGVFEKYAVDDFTVLSDLIRRYEISEIFRTYDESIDGNVSNSDKIDEMSFKVAKLWTAKTFADGVEYSCKDVDVVTVTEKCCGALFYEKNVWSPVAPVSVAGFSHFVAFSTDRDIDKLVEVQLSYIATEKEHREWWIWFEKDIDFGSKTHNVVITDKDRAVITLDGTFTRDDYIRERISTSSAFLNSENLQSIPNLYDELSQKQFVVRFHESTYTKTSGMGGVYERFTQISDVTLLRLRFETDGIMYNLGVVDNKQMGSLVIDGSKDDWLDWFKKLIERIIKFFTDNWHWIVIGVIGVILLIVCMPFMPLILQAIVTVFSFVFKSLWWLISAPFKWIYRKIRGE